MNRKVVSRSATPARSAQLRRAVRRRRVLLRRARYQKFTIECGERTVQWDLADAKRIRVPVTLGDTDILVRTREAKSELPAGTPVAMYLLSQFDTGEEEAPTICRISRGSAMVFSPLAVLEDSNSYAVEVEYRESFLRRLAWAGGRLIRMSWQAFQTTADEGPEIRTDFCLADLKPQELRHPATWQTLLSAFVALPFLVAGTVALVLWAAGVSPSTVLFGAISGALVAFTGTAICSAPVSVLAASLGGIPISVVLGIFSGLLLQAKGGVQQAGGLLADTLPVIPGLGGLSALVQPSGISVVLVATSVVLLSLAMGRVRSIAGQASGPWTGAGVLKAIGIGMVGAMGPGLVFGISSLGSRGRTAELAFALGLAVIGGLAFGAAAGLRARSSRRGVFFGMCYGVLTLLLIALGLKLESTYWRLLLATTTNHILLQGTFFGWTYVAAEKIGGPRSGVIASAVEGVPPYCIFILMRP